MELFYKERNAQTYDTTTIPDATLDDIDPEAIASYRRERQAINPNASELNYDNQKLLFSLNAIARHPTQKGEYCLTFAGLILFGNAIALRRYFPMHRIDYILVEGKEWVSDPDRRYQSIEIREPLLLAIPKLITLVRNEKIAAVLHEVNIAETKGSGGRVMLEKMLEANLSLPLFVSNRDRDYFHLTLFTHHLLDGEDIEWLTQFKNYGLSNDEAKALVILKQGGIINNLIYRVTNDVDTLTASQHLRRLRDAGLLEQQGKGSATCYTLNPQFLPKEKIAIGEATRTETDNSNLDSSTVEGETLSRQSSTPNPLMSLSEINKQ